MRNNKKKKFKRGKEIKKIIKKKIPKIRLKKKKINLKKKKAKSSVNKKISPKNKAYFNH